MALSVTMLGSGGWIPTPARHTASALVRDGERAVIIDAGTGLHKLLAEPELLHGVEHLDLLLTHFHLDHVCGLAYVAALDLPCPLRVLGPGELLYGRSTADVLASVSKEPVHPVSLQQLGVEVGDIPVGPLELGSWHVTHRAQQRHSQPTLGLRFGEAFAWVTDTAYEPEAAEFAAGVHTLFHEGWTHAGEPMDDGIHSTGADAGQSAVDAGAERLVLIHLNPRPGLDAPSLTEAQDLFPGAVAASDGAVYLF